MEFFALCYMSVFRKMIEKKQTMAINFSRRPFSRQGLFIVYERRSILSNIALYTLK